MMMRRVSDAGSVDEDDGGDKVESIARLREEIRKLRDETRVALDSTAEEKAKLEAETVDITERVEQLELEVHTRKALLSAPAAPTPAVSAAAPTTETSATIAEAAASAGGEDVDKAGSGDGQQQGPMRTRLGSLDSDTVGAASRKSACPNSPSNSTKRMSFTRHLTQFLKGGAAQEGSAEEPSPGDHADTHSLDGAAVAAVGFGQEGSAAARRGAGRGAAGDLTSVQEAHKADVRQLQLKLESTESTIAMMEEISRIQQENISALRADIAYVQDKLSDHHQAHSRDQPATDNDDNQDPTVSPEGSQSGGPLDLAQLSGDAKALAMIQMKQGQRRDLVLKQELKQVRAAMEKSAEERASLERRIAETTAQEAVLKMQMAMECNRFAEEVLDAETAKKHSKLLTKLRKRNSCRVIDMLCDSLDDAPEIGGDGDDEDGRDEVIMEVLMRQSILQKMTDTLDRDAKSIERLREVILHPLFLSTTEEVVSEVCHVVQSLGTLLDVRWNRHQELWEALLERDEVLCQLQHESVRHQDTVRLLQLDLTFLRQETKQKIQTGLDAMERICQQVAVLRGELVDRDLQLAQLQHVQEENTSRSNSVGRKGGMPNGLGV